jgi:hypothetical protein
LRLDLLGKRWRDLRFSRGPGSALTGRPNPLYARARVLYRNSVAAKSIARYCVYGRWPHGDVKLESQWNTCTHHYNYRRSGELIITRSVRAASLFIKSSAARHALSSLAVHMRIYLLLREHIYTIWCGEQERVYYMHAFINWEHCF